jgi:hypothetical protein
LSEFLDRRAEVLQLAFDKTVQFPLQESGFWFYGDLRDNVYLALHGMVHLYECDPIRFMENEQFQLCERVLCNALRLQDTDPSSETYGHWPMRLAENIDNPLNAPPNRLTVELMGCLLIYYTQKYPLILSEKLKNKLQDAIQHIYLSKLYIQPISQWGHHEAKHTALKLLLGFVNEDPVLLKDGHEGLNHVLAFLRLHGFREYGLLVLGKSSCGVKFALHWKRC